MYTTHSFDSRKTSFFLCFKTIIFCFIITIHILDSKPQRLYKSICTFNQNKMNITSLDHFTKQTNSSKSNSHFQTWLILNIFIFRRWPRREITQNEDKNSLKPIVEVKSTPPAQTPTVQSWAAQKYHPCSSGPCGDLSHIAKTYRLLPAAPCPPSD